MSQTSDTTRALARLPAAAWASAALVWPAVAGILWGPHRPRSGAWYALLRKPTFQPPNTAIPLAWGAVETGLAVGAYRLFRQPAGAQPSRALRWWGVNVALIGAWSGVFFGARSLPASTVLAAAMVGTGAAYVAEARQVDLPAARSGLPYVAWVAFATVLTAALWRRNR